MYALLATLNQMITLYTLHDYTLNLPSSHLLEWLYWEKENSLAFQELVDISSELMLMSTDSKCDFVPPINARAYGGQMTNKVLSQAWITLPHLWLVLYVWEA